MKKLSKGILIAIEGIDGAGKTTQVARQSEHFKRHGYDVVTFKEPTEGEYGQKIRMLAQFGRHVVTHEEESELFLRDRMEDCEKNIVPALSRNALVFMDRYYFSNVAYQGALGLDKDEILRRNQEIAPVPDLVIILDVAAVVGLNRIRNLRKENHNHFEKEDYLNKVRQVFKRLDFPYIQRIDGSRDEDTVAGHIKSILVDLIEPLTLPDSYQEELFKADKETNKPTYSKN